MKVEEFGRAIFHDPDYAAIWDYDGAPKEANPGCETCGHDMGLYWKTTDRYGYAVRLQECIECHRVWFNPRMTREAYARFYETAYRPLVSAFHGREINAQTIETEQIDYAVHLGQLLEARPAFKPDRYLDIGGSTGIVARHIGLRLGASEITVLDPSPSELARAQPSKAIRGLIEDVEFIAGQRFDLITLCQTADHLLDLMGSLKKIKGLLSPDGLFWSDIVDFNVTREVKIDHPFNLTESTYRQFLLKAGFSLLQVNYAPDGKHIGFLCK